MSINTKIEGNPESVRAAARWVRDSLEVEISQAVDSIYSARNTSDAGWDGNTGDAFSTRMTNGAQNADTLATATTDSATVFDTFAGELQRAQTDMQLVRDAAQQAGLTLTDTTIEDPGAGPPDPGSPPTGDAATPDAITTYNASVTARNNHNAKVHAYEAAAHAAEAARTMAKLAGDMVKNVWADVTSKWFFVIGDLINGGAGALVTAHSSTLLQKSQRLTDEAATLLDRAQNAPAGTPAQQIYDDFDRSRLLTREADEIAEAARNAERTGSRVGLKVGGALAVAGIVYDIANGKDVDQAIVSGGLGFGASVAAGAVIGSFIPVPIAGTVAGALGGAVVGIFTSGAVDSLYQNGFGSVGDVIGDGFGAVGDTGEAIGSLATDAWHALF